MNDADKRRFPRIHHVSSRELIHIDDAQTPEKHVVLTENLSACGIKFTTNAPLVMDAAFLIYLNDVLVADMDMNAKNLLKSGDYYLARVVWAKQMQNDFTEIGAAFLEKKNCASEDIDTFTELVNVSMLDLLGDQISH